MLALRRRRELGVSAPVTALNRILVRRFDAIVVTSSFAHREFAPLAQAAGPAVHRVPLGVDLELFRPAEGADPASGPLRLVHAGRLSREKSPHLAVATAVELHTRGVPVRPECTATVRTARNSRRSAAALRSTSTATSLIGGN